MKVVKELDGLPLALTTAGAYLENVTTSFEDYLRLYKKSWLRLQKTSPQLSSYEDRALYTTWQVTFDRIQQQNEASANLLRLWAYLDRQDLWFGLLQSEVPVKEKWFNDLIEDEISFNEAIRPLCDFGLVDPNLASRQLFTCGGYSMHSCVHSWTASVLNKEWDRALARIALGCVASQIPKVRQKGWWLVQRRILPHASKLEPSVIGGHIDLDGMEWALVNIGFLFNGQNKLAQAETVYTQALELYNKSSGPNSGPAVEIINSLGLLSWDLGKQEQAEALFARAMHCFEDAIEETPASAISATANLGNLYLGERQVRSS